MKLIIGYGNPLRTDDGIGAIVAEALGGIALIQLEPELSEMISRADFVVLIDAAVGEKLGEIHKVYVAPQPNASLSHFSSPEALLNASQQLYHASPPMLLISITGKNFDFGDALSPELQVLLPRLIPQVQAIIQSHDKA